jgi:hypothetical protein
VKPFACLLLRFPVESAPVSHSLYLDEETERPESHLIIFSLGALDLVCDHNKIVHWYAPAREVNTGRGKISSA